MSSSTWIVVEETAGRTRGAAQPLWPNHDWHETDVHAVGPDGPGARLVLSANAVGPYRIEISALTLG
jgi:hypothetical protein